MAHTLIVSVDPYDDEGVVGSVECSEVTESCRTWWECDKQHEYDTDTYGSLADAVYEGVDLFHGVEHCVIDAMVMTPSDQCIANTLAGAQDGICDAVLGLTPGRYPCEVAYEGDEYVSVEVVSADVPA